jgi:ribosomal protein S6--L-glutamate ligase
MKREPIVIGWTELVDLPDWKIRRLRAKIDTGARTSALHVERIQELAGGRVRFDVVLHREKRDRRVHVTTRIVKRGRVRSSNGETETRYFVRTRMRLGPVERDVEVSLVDRGKMIHRMLLGRTALSGPFLVDVDRRMVQSRPTRMRSTRAR